MDSQCFGGDTSTEKVTVIEGSGTLADANYSTSATATELEFDNTNKYWTHAKAVLSCSFTVAPTDQSTVTLFIFEQDISGTNDVAGPAATDVQGARSLGTFTLDDTTSQQYQTLSAPFSLFGVRKAKFSILNGGGQTMDADFSVTIEGVSLYDT